MITAALIGRTYFTGNTFNAEECTVTHLVAFEDLSAEHQRRWTEMCAQRGEDPRNDGYVCYQSKRKHDHVSYYLVLPIRVFCAVVFETFDAMVTERTRQDTGSFSGLLRCTLPGDR
jgi:hypothetical protein